LTLASTGHGVSGVDGVEHVATSVHCHAVISPAAVVADVEVELLASRSSLNNPYL
jgi:hypothetical protein